MTDATLIGNLAINYAEVATSVGTPVGTLKAMLILRFTAKGVVCRAHQVCKCKTFSEAIMSRTPFSKPAPNKNCCRRKTGYVLPKRLAAFFSPFFLSLFSRVDLVSVLDITKTFVLEDLVLNLSKYSD
jgi:hypothetical protein